MIANWTYSLMRDTGGTLLDMNSAWKMADNVRHVLEDNGDKVLDLHVWRLGLGHMGSLVSAETSESQRTLRFYHSALKRFRGLSHVTVQVNPSRAAARAMPVNSPCIDACRCWQVWLVRRAMTLEDCFVASRSDCCCCLSKRSQSATMSGRIRRLCKWSPAALKFDRDRP